jgi:hypothetical protein
LTQWLLLRRRCAHAGLWIAGSALGLAAGLALVLATGLIDGPALLPVGLVVLVYTGVTGVMLVWLLGKTDAEKPAVGKVS